MATINFTVDDSGLEGFTVDNLQGTFIEPSGESYGHIRYNAILTVDNGKVVTETPVVKVTLYEDNIASVKRANGVLQSDGTYKITMNTAISPYSDTWRIGNAILSGRAIENEIMSKYGFVGAYLATKNNIIALANIRFYVETGATTSERVDLGKYILSYVHYPFAVETDNNANVVLGFYTSNVNCALISTQYKSLVLFNDIINGEYQNETDNNNVDIKLLLPYYGVYQLSSDYINKHIKVNYKVDLLSNDCLITIECEGLIVETLTATVGYEEPFITKDSSVEQTFTNKINSNPNKHYRGGVYVYQKLNPTHDRLNVRIRKTVSELTGFVKGDFDSFEPISEITNAEIDMIRRAFNGGVNL